MYDLSGERPIFEPDLQDLRDALRTVTLDRDRLRREVDELHRRLACCMGQR